MAGMTKIPIRTPSLIVRGHTRSGHLSLQWNALLRVTVITIDDATEADAQ